jgi:hypothetical protein
MARSAIVINLIILPPPFFCATATWLQNTIKRMPKEEITVFNDFLVASPFISLFNIANFFSLFLIFSDIGLDNNTRGDQIAAEDRPFTDFSIFESFVH